MIRRDGVFQVTQFQRYRGGGALLITPSERWLGAPIARIRTAAGRRHVPRETAVAVHPRPAIVVRAGQVPGGQGQPVESFLVRTDSRAARFSQRTRKRQTRDAVEIGGGVAVPRGRQALAGRRRPSPQYSVR